MLEDGSKVLVALNVTYLAEVGTFTSDGNVAVSVDGTVVCALSEERISRRKYDGGFLRSLKYALERSKIRPDEVDGVVIVGFAMPVGYPVSEHILRPLSDIGIDAPVHVCPSHHEAHAWSTLLDADNNQYPAIIAVLDHTGSILEEDPTGRLERSAVEQTSYYLWTGSKIELVARDHQKMADVGYGRFYSKATQLAGFRSYHDAGKLMGLAPFGTRSDNTQVEVFTPKQHGHEDTSVSLSLYSEDGIDDLRVWLEANNGAVVPTPGETTGPVHANLALWAQTSLETSVIRRLRGLVGLHHPQAIYLAGGVALNSVLNGAIEREIGLPVYIPPSPGDAGIAMGALAHFLYTLGSALTVASPYLGPKYSEDEIHSVLTSRNAERIKFYRSETIPELTAKYLSEGKIVARFHGRSEFGPRALGNRSILARPDNPWTKEVINGFVKKREWFRPFAPSVLSSRLSDFFEAEKTDDHRYMMKTVYAKPSARGKLSSVIHIDGSARVQAVDEQINPDYARLLEAMDQRIGLPIVLNTSFNLGGEPIVETPQEALDSFIRSEGIDVLTLGPFVVTRI